ncbi:MAG: PAS domain-containing protein, partial [Okeania sp. SIO3C4]|nr:PAS domain-containing protein [Okeania sp. SIO3C4]
TLPTPASAPPLPATSAQNCTAELAATNASLSRDIQTRVAAEQALQSHQAFLGRVLNAITDPIFVKDHQHRWITVNDAFCRLMNQPRVALLGKSEADFLTATQAAESHQLEARLFTTQGEAEIEENFTTDCGETLTLLTKRVAVTNAQAQPTLVGIIRDITERQQLREDLRQTAVRSQALLRAVERVRETLDLDAIFSATTRELQQVLACDRVVIYRFRPDWSVVFVAESVGAGWKSLLGVQSDETEILDDARQNTNAAGCTLKQMRTRQLAVKDTYLQDTQGGTYRLGEQYRQCDDIYTANFPDCYIE